MTRSRRTGLTLAVGLLVVIGFTAGAQAENYKGYVRSQSIISPQELNQLIQAKDPNLIVIAVASPASYTMGHIPGALQVWRSDYEPKEGEPFPYEGMMLNRADFEKFARGLGINNDSKVVLYDEKYDATRVWWGFFLYGKEDVRVLDGGYQGWKHAGFDTASGMAPKVEKAGAFTASQPRPGWLVGIWDVWQAKNNADYQLWDNREPNEWNGEQLKKGAFRKGRIPWANFLSWKDFKSKVEGEKDPTEFKDAAGLKAAIEKAGIREGANQVFYCQSGVRTTTLMFGLYLMGWNPDLLHNYDGSWIEWSYYKELPIVNEKGD